MQHKACGFLIGLIIFTGLHHEALAQESRTLELEPIVVAPKKNSFLKLPQVKNSQVNNVIFSSALEAVTFSVLDLQPRSSRGAIQADLSLRASNFEQVLILLNGQRINDPQTGHFNADLPLTKADVDKIELLTAGGSVLRGPNAIGGAVNIILKKPGEKRGILELKGGEHRTHFQLLSVSDKVKDLGFRVSLENHRSAGFREDTGFNNFIGSLATLLEFPAGEMKLNYGYQEKVFGAFDFYTPGQNYLSQEWDKTHLMEAGLKLSKGDLSFKPNFLWRGHYDKFMLDRTALRTRYLNHHENNTYTPGIYLEKQFSLVQKAGIGAEYGRENINSTSLGKHQRNHESLYIDASRDFSEKFSLGTAFRWDNYSVFGSVFSGSLNAKYRISSGKDISLVVSKNSRIPSFTELYYNDPTTLGNPNLSAEEALTYELGFNYKRSNLGAALNLFFRNEHDMIDWVKRLGAQAKFQSENISRDQVGGVEASLEFKLNQYLTWQTSYAYANKQIESQGYIYKYGLNYTRHLYNNIFNFHLPFGIQTLALNYKKKPGRASWLLADLGLSYNLSNKSQVFFTVANLLNAKYEEIAGIPQPGRWVEGGVKVEW